MAVCEAVFALFLQNGNIMEVVEDKHIGYNQCISSARREEREMIKDNYKTKFFKDIKFVECLCSGSIGIGRSSSKRGR